MQCWCDSGIIAEQIFRLKLNIICSNALGNPPEENLFLFGTNGPNVCAHLPTPYIWDKKVNLDKYAIKTVIVKSLVPPYPTHHIFFWGLSLKYCINHNHSGEVFDECCPSVQVDTDNASALGLRD